MKFAPLFFLKIMIRGLTNTQKSGAYYSLMNNRPLVYRYTVLEVLMNTFKSVKKQLKFCIRSMEDSSSLFVVHPQKDFSRKRKHFSAVR